MNPRTAFEEALKHDALVNRVAALKSRQLLYKELQDMQREGFGIKLPSSYKDLSNEIYGRKAMIYIKWDSREDRQRGEKELMRRGFKVETDYWPGSKVSEIQVSYFKGWHWDE